ncbi:MAG TPA: NOB1 family endonuclease [Methanosarcinales archaeon]|nr:NOB1 family endonuclease [Methanosarcinales archaeon]
MPAYIADSSVFILGMPLPSSPRNRTVTTPDVIAELKDMRSKMALEAAVDQGMQIETPLPHLVSEICDHARVTGDLDRLSETDIGLLAKALEYDGILCTDDYAIQNVAGSLGIKTEPIAQEQIREIFEWGMRCTGCGRRFESGDQTCPVCGSRLLGYRKNKKRL